MKKISQSFITDMREYIAGGSCGHQMREKWINDKLFELNSKAVKLGSYFEYIFTEMMLGPGKGSLPKSGKIPGPLFMITSIKKNAGKTEGLKVEDMYAEYRLAHERALKLKEYFEIMGIKILRAGKRLTKGRFEGTIDLECEATKLILFNNCPGWEVGMRFVIDLKYAGTIDDRWSKHGWTWTEEQSKYHGTQAIQYHYITNLPFFFMVISSSPTNADVKLFWINILQSKIDAHVAEANNLEEKLRVYNEIGWEPRPELLRCSECPLAETCKDKATYPQAEQIVI